MKKISFTAALLLAFAAGAAAQQSPFPPPSSVEKDLAARASDVSEVTLDKSMLGFASKFMDKHGKDDAETQQLIQGLDGIYVRNYEFDKDGAVSQDDINSLRKHYETAEWTPMVHERERKSGETDDIMVKLVNGQPQGIFILSAEPRELSIVLILGPIHPDQLSKLKGLGGLGALGALGAGAGSSTITK
jgi:hypothetical protein